MRARLLVGAFCAVPLHAQIPSPLPGEYVCTQSSLVVSGVSTTGLPPATSIVSSANALGNLVIERGGSYRMTGVKGGRATYRFEPREGRVVFAGMLAGLANTYGTRGRSIFFDFTSTSISFSCALPTSTDYGQQVGTRTGQNGAPAVTRRAALNGTLFFSSRDGLMRLNLADGRSAVVSSTGQFDVRGSELVFITAKGELAITTLDGTGTRVIPVYGTSNQLPRFSEDAQRIAFLGLQRPTSADDALLGAYSSATMQPLVVDRSGRVQAAFGSGYTQPTWTPDGRVVMAGTAATGSLAGNAQTGIFVTTGRGDAVRRIDPNLDAPHSPAVSPDGAWVACVNGARIWLLPLNGGTPRTLFEGASRFLSALTWSPDGQQLIFADNQVLKSVSRSGAVVPVQDQNGHGIQATGTAVWR
jgi:WD40 repeat protein